MVQNNRLNEGLLGYVGKGHVTFLLLSVVLHFLEVRK